MEQRSCDVTDCGKPIKRAGFCYGHYMKNWRYGTPEPAHPSRWVDLRGQRFGNLVVRCRAGRTWECDCDCGATTTVRAGDLNRGNAISCGDSAAHWRRDGAGYGAAHQRVRADRGSASAHQCVDCGGQAQHWSYNHDDVDGLVSIDTGAAYSLKPKHYSPRCVPCHKRFDLGRPDASA